MSTRGQAEQNTPDPKLLRGSINYFLVAVVTIKFYNDKYGTGMELVGLNFKVSNLGIVTHQVLHLQTDFSQVASKQ